MKVLAVIPARSGSKSVPNKNVRMFAGKPMLTHSISHAQQSKYIDRIIVSTDSMEYAEIARAYGAETPFLRPGEYATDDALDFEVFMHCLVWLRDHENYTPDLVVHLRPTYPVRNPFDIDRMIEMLAADETADSIRSVALSTEIPYKMWRKDKDGQMQPLLNDIEEAYNMPRQALPKVYYQNACIDIFRADTILLKHSMTGNKILGYEMTENYDIDTEEDLLNAMEFSLLAEGKKKFVIDIDGVVAKLQPDLDYAAAEPDMDMVNAINKLYDRGNTIVMFTARGYVTGLDWRNETEKQFKNWGLKYHNLLFGKPNADYYVDDHLISPQKLLRLGTMLSDIK